MLELVSSVAMYLFAFYYCTRLIKWINVALKSTCFLHIKKYSFELTYLFPSYPSSWSLSYFLHPVLEWSCLLSFLIILTLTWGRKKYIYKENCLPLGWNLYIHGRMLVRVWQILQEAEKRAKNFSLPHTVGPSLSPSHSPPTRSRSAFNPKCLWPCWLTSLTTTWGGTGNLQLWGYKEDSQPSGLCPYT